MLSVAQDDAVYSSFGEKRQRGKCSKKPSASRTPKPITSLSPSHPLISSDQGQKVGWDLANPRGGWQKESDLQSYHLSETKSKWTTQA